MRFLFGVLLLAGIATAQTGPFSHRVHLALKKQCTDCHAAALTSASVEDNLLPPKEVCKPCHDSVTIPPPPRVAIAKFSHSQHLKLGNIAPVLAAAIKSKTYLSAPGDLGERLNTKNPCEACHRGMAESNAVTPDALPRMADCLVCHSQIDLPFSCETCHSKGANLKPANHTGDFIDVHSRKTAPLDRSTCAVCHGRRFTCMGCHSG